MDAIVSYQKEVPVFKYAIAGMLYFAFFYSLYYGQLNGFIAMMLASYLISTEGSEIDLNARTYRNFHALFGLKIGKWKPVPAFDYVSVFAMRENQTVNVLSASATVQSKVIVLNAFYGNRHITFFKTTKKDEAFRVARHIAEILQIDILDATAREKVWL